MKSSGREERGGEDPGRQRHRVTLVSGNHDKHVIPTFNSLLDQLRLSYLDIDRFTIS